MTAEKSKEFKYKDPINEKRRKQFETMTNEELEIYKMNLKDDDPHLTPLIISNEVNIFGFKNKASDKRL